jgi:hypothetical protein
MTDRAWSPLEHRRKREAGLLAVLVAGMAVFVVMQATASKPETQIKIVQIPSSSTVDQYRYSSDQANPEYINCARGVAYKYHGGDLHFRQLTAPELKACHLQERE